MPDILIRNVDALVVKDLKRRAKDLIREDRGER